MKNFVLGVSLFLVSTSGSATPFSVDDLHKAMKAATEAFKEEFGVALHDSISGYQMNQLNEGGRAKIFYKEEGQAKIIEYFCHFHDGDEMDCHDL